MPSLLKEELKTILHLTKKNNYNYFVETGTLMGETILRFIDDFIKVYKDTESITKIKTGSKQGGNKNNELSGAAARTGKENEKER